MRRAAIFVAFLGTAGCLWENPGFNPTGAGASESGGVSTDGAPTTGSGGSSGGSGSDGGTGTAGGSTGTTGGGTTGGETTGGTTGGGTTGGMLGSIGCPDHPDLLACYLFEIEPVGVLSDRSGNMLDFSMNNVTLVDGPPNYGSAGMFSANSEVKRAEHPAFDLDALTISMLVNPAGGDGQIFDNDLQYGIRLMGEKIACSVVVAPSELVTVNAAITVGVWSHVFCSYDGQWLVLHVEEFGETKAVSGALKKDSANGVVLGNESPTPNFPFVGSIDHVLVFDAGLPEAERCKFGLNPCP